MSHCRKCLFDLKKNVRKMSVIVKVFVLPQPFKNHGESAVKLNGEKIISNVLIVK